MRWRRVHDFYRPLNQVVPVEFVPVRLVIGQPDRSLEKLAEAPKVDAAEGTKRHLRSPGLSQDDGKE